MFQSNNEFGKLNKGRKRPDLSLRNSKGMSLETRKKLSKSKKGKGFVFRVNNPCPHCKSTHVVSAGSSWRCFDCKRTWKKAYKQKEDYVRKQAFRSEVSCPNCGSHHVKSAGESWHCCDCNKEWMKQYKKKEDYSFVRKLDVSVEEIRRLYHEEKLSQSQIAKKYNVSQGTVFNFMRKHGLQPRPKHVVLKNHFNSENLKRGYEKVSKAMKGNTNWRFSHQYPNNEEKKLIRFFNKWNLPFKYVGDGSFKIDGKCPDFVNEERKLIIEFFGELWHEDSDELKRIDFFNQHGWKCLIVWGKEVGAYLKGEKQNYRWELILRDKILKWMAGL